MPLSKTLHPVFLVCFVLVSAANATGSVKIENAWSPEAPPVAKVMAGYMKINNHSNKNLKIHSVESSLFKNVGIHLTTMKDGIMRMEQQDNLLLKANSVTELKPGGLHLMLMGKLKPIKTGSVIPVTLTLNNGEIIKVDLKVNNEPQKEHHHH